VAHYCRICERYRANEKFSGKGHKIHVCKDCMRLPKEERQRIEEEQEIWDFLRQSNISQKNLARLKRLAASPNAEIGDMAQLVLEVGRAHPLKKNRLGFLARERKDLLERLEETGLIYACMPY
jgi:ribosome-binding protein aMBF1 (putative translation factor)